MTFPPDGTMLLLLALQTGEGLEVRGGELFLTLPDGTTTPVRPAALDTLEAAGWVEVTEAGAVPTDRAGYALNRWLTGKARERGHRGRYELKSARVSAAGR